MIENENNNFEQDTPVNENTGVLVEDLVKIFDPNNGQEFIKSRG